MCLFVYKSRRWCQSIALTRGKNPQERARGDSVAAICALQNKLAAVQQALEARRTQAVSAHPWHLISSLLAVLSHANDGAPPQTL